jgi:hypothetical protein
MCADVYLHIVKYPAGYLVKIPQLFFETIFDTTQFNDPGDWPTDGSHPFGCHRE